MAEETPRTISVSRDALRADLAELELRLRSYFETALAQKANAHTVEELTKRVDLHEAGIFPPAWELKIGNQIESKMLAHITSITPERDRQIKAMIDDRIDARKDERWALRSNKANFALAFASLSSVGIALTALLHSFLSMH